MSPVRLNGSTSGYTELSAPAVAGNNSIALPTGNGTAYQILRNGATAGTTEFTDKIVSGTAVASTSGTSIDFTGIPSWVKRVTVMLNGVSTSGTSVIHIRLGTSSGVESTGYLGGICANGASENATAGIAIGTGGETSSTIRHGAVCIANITSNTWVAQGSIGRSESAQAYALGFSKTLSGTLDRVRITTVNGTDTFDAGSINILME